MKSLVFGAGLLEPTLAGRKKVTLRSYRPEAHDFHLGEVVIGKFAEGRDLPLRITESTVVRPFSAIPEDVFTDDGFRDRADAIERMRGYYPHLNENTIMAIIRFELAEPVAATAE